MKYITKILNIILISFIASGIFSCSNGKSADKTEEVDNNESDEKFTIVRVYCFTERISSFMVDGKYPLLVGTYGSPSLALRNSSGELLRFDNDADYSELCPAIRFITDALDDDTCIKLLDLDRSDNWIREYNDNIEENNKIVRKYEEAIISGAIDYLQGNKEKITDQVVFQRLDETFYNTHPTERVFYESESSYNSKTYDSNNNNGKVYVENSSKDTWDKPIKIFADGTKVPEGTLLFFKSSIK